MMGKTHLVIGGASWLGLALLQPSVIHGTMMIAGGWFIASLSALGPDLDQKQSMGSNILGPVTQALSWGIRQISGGHRKLTHSLLALIFLILIEGTCIAVFHFAPWIALAILLGWVSHILADMLTVEGVPLLYPWSKHKDGLHLVHTGKKWEHYFIFPLAILANLAFIGLVVIL